MLGKHHIDYQLCLAFLLYLPQATGFEWISKMVKSVGSNCKKIMVNFCKFTMGVINTITAELF